MSDSLLDEIIQFEDEISTRIATGKQQIRERMEKRQNELETRYAACVARLNERHASMYRQQIAKAKQLCAEQMLRCEEKIAYEKDLSEQRVISCIKELLVGELWGDQDDHQNVQS